MIRSLAVLCLFLFASASAQAANAAKAGKLSLERPTLICLGVHWQVRGDDNKNAKVTFEYRKSGAEVWQSGLDLLRIVNADYNRAVKKSKATPIPKGVSVFAGSIFDLMPDTKYELRLKLTDPDGGDKEQILQARTRGVPKAFDDGRKIHVKPGSGGGTGTEDDPYRGLDAADEAAQPGDIILVHKGVYKGTWTVRKSGTPGKPVIWRGGVDGEAIIDGKGDSNKLPGRTISAGDINDVHFENLTIRNGKYLVVCHSSLRMVMTGCNLYGGDYGFVATNNTRRVSIDFYLADNTLKGPSTWPRTKGIEGARGFQVSGLGHVVCYNRIEGYADAVDTFPSRECSSIDFYGNEISEMTDDGIEMDYSQRNTRCFRNRMTNVFQGVTTQPTYGGPVYIFRNVLYNVGMSTFKMHNGSSGILVFHNTSVKAKIPLVLYGSFVNNSTYRNNLFIGTGANYAYESTSRMINCDFDYDGWGGGPWKQFIKWNKKRYNTIADLKNGPVYKNAVLVDVPSCFKTKIVQPKSIKTKFAIKVNDLRPAEGSGVIDKGAKLPNINDGFKGEAPDLGAYEFGEALPHYGPRPKQVWPALRADAGKN